MRNYSCTSKLVVGLGRVVIFTPYIMLTVRLSCAQVVVISHKRPMTRKQSEQEAAQAYFSLIMPSTVSARVWSAISASPSVVIAGEEEWQTLRIKQGALFFCFGQYFAYCSTSYLGRLLVVWILVEWRVYPTCKAPSVQSSSVLTNLRSVCVCCWYSSVGRWCLDGELPRR